MGMEGIFVSEMVFHLRKHKLWVIAVDANVLEFAVDGGQNLINESVWVSIKLFQNGVVLIFGVPLSVVEKVGIDFLPHEFK